MNANRNISIDSMRFVCAFFVVCQHIRLYPELLSLYVSGFVRVSVPFFFLVSGYHLYDYLKDDFVRKIDLSLASIYKTIAIYYSAYVAWWHVRSKYFGEIFQKNDFDAFGFVFFNGSVEHLWYLFAFVYAVIFLKLVGNKIVNFYSIVFLFAVYAAASLYSRSMPISEYKGWVDLNWITMGLQYIIIGMFIKKHRKIFLFEKNKLILIIILLLGLVYVEHALLKMLVGRGPSIFAIYLLSIAVFVYTINGYVVFSESFQQWSSKIGKRSSLDVYIHHVWVKEIFIVAGFKSAANAWVVFITICFVSYFLRGYRENIK